ncbi:peroxidase mlt-7-like isoform X2 [Adelges cooleyi]|uniref:peroxidase mlt-7-like isoform X2 n=1 Tax=Adelges cooleyi TaxID=133065 RepID=UPI00217F4686|nr:peroxidase mlt-7-like isoform X2 [Adelges cooleyi]
MEEIRPLLRPRKKLSFKKKSAIVLFIVFMILATVFIISCIIFKPPLIKKKPHVVSLATTNDDFFVKCAPLVSCDPSSVYRSINGSCNNLQNPAWGASFTPFYRLIDAEFDDGHKSFRLQSNGEPLPNARILTITLFADKYRQCSHKNNELLVPWGQFITHDIAYSPVNSVDSSFPDTLDHCDDEPAPEECTAAIRLDPHDPVYGKYKLPLLKFMRSVTSDNFSCPLVPTTVLNQNTHYIDASNVYGSDEKLASNLRLYDGGQLRFSVVGKEQYCPFDTSIQVTNATEKSTPIAFLAGDGNVNQNLAIALFQNLFLRFHNYLANKLQSQHPSWSDEKVYQESRRIVGAVNQIITYDHFLPILLGKDYIDRYGINGKTKYDSTLSATMSQEMTSSAFRLIHNIIPAKYNFIDSNYTMYEEEEPSKLFLKPDSLIGNVDGILRGFVETPGRAPRASYNRLIANIVVTAPAKNIVTGFDLLSYDIQRGRDNGLPPYNKMRKLCGLRKVNSFDALSDYITEENIEKLKSMYSSVDDIDYHVGILLEKPLNDSMVGPSAACVIADTFYRLKNGDRFFYDVENQPGSFTSDQIKSLKNITLSHVICATSNLEQMQKETFSLVDHVRIMSLKPSCKNYNIDLSPW